MKLILLAAAATLALPAAIGAQTTPGQSTTATPADPATATPAPTDGTMAQPGQTTPADPSQAGTAQPAPTDSTQPMSTGTPAGGYQPSGSAMQGQMSPGVQPTYQPAQSPAQAFPAPAPKASYPICKKGQYDGCTEAGGTEGGHKARHRK